MYCPNHPQGYNAIALVSPDVLERAQGRLLLPAMGRVPFKLPTFVSLDFASEHGLLDRLRVSTVPEAMRPAYPFGDPSAHDTKWWRILMSTTPMCWSCLRDAYQGDLEGEFGFPRRDP